jgi:mannose-6-phosphate isomerase-like protein (cupin superfamily)
MENFHVSLQTAIEKLKNEADKKSVLLMSHGTMTLKYFVPKIIDTQTPHVQDELYIISSGSAEFTIEEKRVHCTKGDSLFAPAGVTHRFENFTEDFSTWVIFYGSEGGEGNK